MRAGNRILVAAVIWACGGNASAADNYGVSVYSTAPAALAAGPCAAPAGCATSGGGLRCAAGLPDCNAARCGGSRFHKARPPYPVTLCPGACFGYFPTQWRKWDEVCPTPNNTGMMLDPMKPPLPPSSDDMPPEKPKNGNGVPPPRPVDPKGGMPGPLPVSSLPTIPPYPGPATRY
jgi:hypothetical protein